MLRQASARAQQHLCKCELLTQCAHTGGRAARARTRPGARHQVRPGPPSLQQAQAQRERFETEASLG